MPEPPALEQSALVELLDAARVARDHAYCPYSGYAVGAAVLSARGHVASGCNVENASYGLTICAERNALAAAVAAGLQPGELVAVALVAGALEESAAPQAEAATPCGACLQVLAEFAAPDCIVLCAGADSASEPLVLTLAELLPRAFSFAPGDQRPA